MSRSEFEQTIYEALAMGAEHPGDKARSGRMVQQLFEQSDILSRRMADRLKQFDNGTLLLDAITKPWSFDDNEFDFEYEFGGDGKDPDLDMWKMQAPECAIAANGRVIRRAGDWWHDVLKFHNKFGCYVGRKPSYPPTQAELDLGKRLVKDEHQELMDALDEGDISNIAKEMCDAIYTINGLAIRFGIDLRPIWAAVHASNMTKTGDKDNGGKILKGPSYEPPQTQALIEAQEHHATIMDEAKKKGKR